MKVVIADDEQQHAFLLELFLKMWGYEDLLSMDNGGDALAALESEQGPCIAILDWEMPVLDGVEVVRRIKQAGRRNIYTLIVSAKTQAADRATAAAAGVDCFMAKPYEPEELRQSVMVGHLALERMGYSAAN